MLPKNFKNGFFKMTYDFQYHEWRVKFSKKKLPWLFQSQQIFLYTVAETYSFHTNISILYSTPPLNFNFLVNVYTNSDFPSQQLSCQSIKIAKTHQNSKVENTDDNFYTVFMHYREGRDSAHINWWWEVAIDMSILKIGFWYCYTPLW